MVRPQLSHFFVIMQVHHSPHAFVNFVCQQQQADSMSNPEMDTENNFEKHFSVEEAQALLPLVRETFRQIHALLGYKSSYWGNSSEKAKANGGNGKRAGNPLVALSDQNENDEALVIAQRHIDSLEKLGIIIRDWRRGLIDFPAIYDGREVFLCYELDDGENILYYHGLNEGYAGRRPLKR
jgi:hypothetical protein